MSPASKNNFTKVFSRRSGLDFEEEVFGQSFVEWAYNTSSGRYVTQLRWTQWLFSKLYGLFENSALSKGQIDAFIDRYSILMHEFEIPEGGYASFGDFFVRRFKTGVRLFPEAAAVLGSPAEGRLSVFKIKDARSVLQLKGRSLPLVELVRDEKLAAEFSGGWAFVFRLCPVDYHRFHFPDAGLCQSARVIDGLLHSVNPLAQRQIPDIFLQNQRSVSIFESQNFGKMLLLEVGAIGVGKIVQTYDPLRFQRRGDEKGYFNFGASTTLLLSKEASGLVPDFDLRKRSEEGGECHVLLGEAIAKKAKETP